MKPITTVLFDFDGTIMNTNDVIIQSWQHLFRTVEGKERPLEDIYQTMGEPLYVTMEKIIPQITVKEGVDIYRSFMIENFFNMIRPFPGMPELLEALKEKNYKTGLVTSRIGHTTRAGLDEFGLLPFFDCVVTCDDTDKHKPDPEPIFIAMERLGSTPEETIMVGDSRFDIDSARSAGVRSVLVAWQLAMSEEEINGDNGPDHIIQRPEDLFQILIG
jgi:pyrophosphatase PpaX